MFLFDLVIGGYESSSSESIPLSMSSMSYSLMTSSNSVEPSASSSKENGHVTRTQNEMEFLFQTI